MRVSTSLAVLGLLILLAGCACRTSPAPQTPSVESGFAMFASCTPAQAETWSASPEVGSRLRAAGCFARLAESAGDRSEGLEWAKAGRALAMNATRTVPANATAHYLAAYLTGLAAEREPLRGLSLVPIIQEQAQAAIELDPSLDDAGPHRIMGELLLQAPGFPVSIGDPFAAVEQFQEAVRLAPGNVGNRLGLAESLLETDQGDRACRELAPILREAHPSNMDAADWDRVVRVIENLCKKASREADQ